jgi:hypothetical protein
MSKATELFEKHWKKATNKPLDESTKKHMQYAIDAISEALNQDVSGTGLPCILIEIDGKKIHMTTNSIEHDDVVMFWLIESIYALRNKQYSEFLENKKTN